MTPNELANLKLNGVAVLPGHVENQAGCTGETSQKSQEKACKIKPLIDNLCLPLKLHLDSWASLSSSDVHVPSEVLEL